MSLTRRDFARRTAVTGAGVALAGSVGALATAPNALASTETRAESSESADRHHHGVGYGPLIPDPKGLLALPAGFSYRVITYSGKTKLESGEFTPSNHDGTATFDGPRGTTLLVNNHELGGARAKWPHPVPLTEGLVYDPAAAGGCTVVEIRPGGHVAEWVGIAGTATNCAGGRTPWDTWLTCEETEDKAGANGMTKDHGYVFEVDPDGPPREPEPQAASRRSAGTPTRPSSSTPSAATLYLTEDASGPNGLLYRWTPPKGFEHGHGQLRTLADDAGVAPGLQVLRLRRPVRRRPVPRHARSARSTASTGSTFPTATPRPSPSASSSPPVRSPAPASSKACGGATAARTSSPRTPARESPGQRTTARSGSTTPSAAP